MKRKATIAGIAIAVVAAGWIYFNRAGETPAGQDPLRNLTAANLTELKDLFNAANRDVRVLMLMSPT